MPLVFISHVEPQSVAELAGIQVGDRVDQYNGHSISHPDDILRLSKSIPFTTITVAIERNGKKNPIYIQPRNWGIKLRMKKVAALEDRIYNPLAVPIQIKGSYAPNSSNTKPIKNETPIEPKDQSVNDIFLTAFVFILAFSIILVINQAGYGGCLESHCINAATPKVGFLAIIVAGVFYLHRRSK